MWRRRLSNHENRFSHRRSPKRGFFVYTVDIMKKYIISSFVALALVVGVGSPARAATLAELQAMIAQLTAQIAAMQGQSGTFDEPSVKGEISTNLTIGSRGVDVVTLQNFLIQKGFLTIPNGLAKGYFGQLTKSAVATYQAAVGLEATGFVGPETRAKINAMLGGNTDLGTVTGLTITSVAGKAADNFEIDLNSTAYVAVKNIGYDANAIKVYVGGIESAVTQASGNYIYFKTPTNGLNIGSTYDLYLKKGNTRSNTVKVKVISRATLVIEPNEPLRIKLAQRAYDSRVTILPNGEELLFAIGVESNIPAYANSLEVDFLKVSGSGNFDDYINKISLVDWANRPISSEGEVSYDGNTTIYRFKKLAHKINGSESFFVKIKAKSDMDKSGQFTMLVPEHGLRVGDTTYASGTIKNTITFDPTYTLKKNTTTAQESYVKITSPNNGGTYLYDESVDIKYETNLNNTNSEGITIQLYKTTKERGEIWQPVLTIATKLKDGKYTWKIPRTLPEGEYNIYAVGQGVLAGGQSVGDYTDKPITIKSRPGM